VFVCPRYEGVDHRIRRMVDLELSIGDYVLSGGDVAAMVVIDAVLRLLPGAIDAASTDEESFTDGLLEYPQYTRPAEFRGERVPEILVGGDHAAVARWRHEASLERTARNRPDLLAGPGATGGAAREGRAAGPELAGTEEPRGSARPGCHHGRRTEDADRWEDETPGPGKPV
jgi:tRNA (guanine37-N1)-methyltransferase